MGIAFLTDSIGAFQSNTGQAWHRIMCTLSTGRLMWRGYFGTGGFTLTQIRDTDLSQVLAMSPLPGAVAICGGTHDVGSATFDEAASRAVLLDIIAKLEAAGTKPVLWTLPPRNDATAVNTLVQRGTSGSVTSPVRSTSRSSTRTPFLSTRPRASRGPPRTAPGTACTPTDLGTSSSARRSPTTRASSSTSRPTECTFPPQGRGPLTRPRERAVL